MSRATSLALGLGLISPMAEGERSGSVALRLPEGVNAADTSARLLGKHGLLVSSRAGMLRLSPHIDNTLADVERLIAALPGSMARS